MLGLTDTNLKRLQEGKPIRVSATDFFPRIREYADLDIVVFHATREDSLAMGRAWGIPDVEILNALGEG